MEVGNFSFKIKTINDYLRKMWLSSSSSGVPPYLDRGKVVIFTYLTVVKPTRGNDQCCNNTIDLFCRPKQSPIWVALKKCLCGIQNGFKHNQIFWKLFICLYMALECFHYNILFLNPNAMRHYPLIGVLRNKSVYREQSLWNWFVTDNIFFYFQNRGCAMQRVANYER